MDKSIECQANDSIEDMIISNKTSGTYVINKRLLTLLKRIKRYVTYTVDSYSSIDLV
jgi:hypothetical protein